jgi:sugar lactone lactonase YvrE
MRLLIFIIIISLSACTSKGGEKFQLIAKSQNQLTGVAVSKDARVFTNFPCWSDDVPISVGEVINGQIVPYPNKNWNDMSKDQSFKAVQSVVVDAKNRLWIIDTRNPQFKGVLNGGPIVYVFDLTTNKMIEQFIFPENTYTKDSYFNDIRIDTKNEFAYMTDSGDGAIIVLNISTKKAKRILDNHKSTASEVDHLICDGHRWNNSVDSDGIALNTQTNELYFIALTGHSLYKISTDDLMNDELSEDELQAKVSLVKKVPATDGMMFDKKGNLWLGGLEDNSINVLKKEGRLTKYKKDKRLRWVDSFALGPKGEIYFTTSQIHLKPEQRKYFEILMVEVD